MLSRNKILEQAIHDCYKEMYAKAQPSIDYDSLIECIKSGEIIDTNKTPVYKRHYLSEKEFTYIRNKYVEAYRFKNEWNSNMDLLINNLEKGGFKDVYIKDKNGNNHREVEHTKPIYEIFNQEIGEKIIQLIKDIKNFYRFDREEGEFGCSIALGGSPTSNKETVEEYWKEQGKPIIIEERDPDTFWYRDKYGNKWEEIYNEEIND